MTTHKRTLIKQIAQAHGLSEHKTYLVIQDFLGKIIDTITTEQRLELRGFGVFHVSVKKGRTIHHPETQQPYQLPDTKAVEFRASKKLKAQLNPPQPKAKHKGVKSIT